MPLPWTRMRRVYALLGLVKRYGAERVETACVTALDVAMFEVHRLKRMLVTRAQRARLDPALQLEAWDPTAKVTYDQTLWNELVSLRFLDARAYVAIVGPVSQAPSSRS